VLAVFADWLAEQGQTTRAEYVQLSLRPQLTPAQRRRRDALLSTHRGAWLGARDVSCGPGSRASRLPASSPRRSVSP
jgi:hypothetical protein